MVVMAVSQGMASNMVSGIQSTHHPQQPCPERCSCIPTQVTLQITAHKIPA